MLADFFRAYVTCTYEQAEDLLLQLSERYIAAAKELELHHVPHFFSVHHGRLSSDHYRTLAHVFEVLICDFPDDLEVQRAVHDVLVWYWASRSMSYDVADMATLAELGLRMRASMAFFETDALRAQYHKDTTVLVSCLDDVPKMHRAVHHLPEYMLEFGPYEDLTTEASESANKPLKQIFRVYVCVCVCVCVFVCSAVRTCDAVRGTCSCLPSFAYVGMLI